MQVIKNITFLIFLFGPLVTQAQICQDSDGPQLSLVMSIDMSGSLDQTENAVMMKGYSEAFASVSVVRNLMHCLCAEVAVVFWAGEQEVVFPMTVLDSKEKILSVAGLFANTADVFASYQERLRYTTKVLEGLGASSKYLLENAQGERRAIVIAGDGYDAQLVPNLEEFRILKSEHVRNDIVVHGLPIDVYRESENFIPQATSRLPQIRTPMAETDPNHPLDYTSVSDFYDREIRTPWGFNIRASGYNDVKKAMTELLTKVTCNAIM